MYPDPPYPGYTWPLTQHMGRVSDIVLRQLLLAAVTFRDSRDPATDINNYLIANEILTPNIRSDSQQVDAWRDYQQILPELGLIYSTQLVQKITPTPIALAYLDGGISFKELMTLQALRYQYPNGLKSTVSSTLREDLLRTPYRDIRSLDELQTTHGVLIRPGLLVWQILGKLSEESETDNILSLKEILTYVLRCSNNNDVGDCVSGILSARNGGLQLPANSGAREKRNIQEWMRFLIHTPLFTGKMSRDAHLKISPYGISHKSEIDNICDLLRSPSTFWVNSDFSREGRLSWFGFFGNLNLEIPLISEASSAFEEQETLSEILSVQAEKTVRDPRVVLREFDAHNLGVSDENYEDREQTIHSSYDAGISNTNHQLHDLMVLFVANVCKKNGADIWDDPHSLDLMAKFEDIEYLIEIKSVTPKNFLYRLRYALGQVLQYDYFRSMESSLPRRKVLGFAAAINKDSWYVPFLNDHMNTDVLSLGGEKLILYSEESISKRLFQN
ncbi:MAG: hypothetical protein ABI778_03490 [Ignavibacteriota bacterium]